MNQRFVYGIMLILGLGIIQFTISTTSASNSLNIFPPPPGSNPYGLSYSEHIQNFWKWLLAIPEDASPLTDMDATGEKCSIDQRNASSPVFYLAPGEGDTPSRTCKVPAGKALFVPVMPESLNEKESQGSSVKDLAESAKHEQDTVSSLYLKIDNTEYSFENLSKYRTSTPPFNVTLPSKGSFGLVGAGTIKAVADGYYVITEPLERGNHTVEYKSLLGNGGDVPFWGQNVRTKIIAK